MAAEIVAVDWAGVLTVATANAKRAGVQDRYRTKPGDAFTVDYGDGYDIVLLTNFLHHFDLPTCTGLLRKVAAALKPGGRAVILEFVPNPDRVSPPMAAGFSLMMLATTPAGDAYTLAEIAVSEERAEPSLEEQFEELRLDHERRWFRFHHLFADLLRRRSQQDGDFDRSALLVRAAAWCSENGAIGEAVAYASRVGHTRMAADLVAQHPEKFHPTIDWDWQRTQLKQEREAEIAAGICGPDGCPVPWA